MLLPISRFILFMMVDNDLFRFRTLRFNCVLSGKEQSLSREFGLMISDFGHCQLFYQREIVLSLKERLLHLLSMGWHQANVRYVDAMSDRFELIF